MKTLVFLFAIVISFAAFSAFDSNSNEEIFEFKMKALEMWSGFKYKSCPQVVEAGRARRLEVAEAATLAKKPECADPSTYSRACFELVDKALGKDYSIVADGARCQLSEAYLTSIGKGKSKLPSADTSCTSKEDKMSRQTGSQLCKQKVKCDAFAIGEREFTGRNNDYEFSCAAAADGSCPESFRSDKCRIVGVKSFVMGIGAGKTDVNGYAK